VERNRWLLRPGGAHGQALGDRTWTPCPPFAGQRTRRCFAYSNELSEWLKGSRQTLEPDESASTESPPDGHPESVSDESKSSAGSFAASTRNLIASRVTAWLLPLVLVASVIVFVGNDGLRFRASANRHIPNSEAQDLYLKGRYFWDRRTPDDLNKAVDYFTQAIVNDPRDAQAYVGLADCYNLLREFGAMAPNEAYSRALAAAQRAVDLDNTSAEAHESLAFTTFWWSWRGVTAEREFKRAIELDPNLARAHHWYGTYLLGRHRFPEALDQIEQARVLEPSSTAILADKVLALWRSRQPTEALALLTQLEAEGKSLSSIHDYLGAIYWDEKDYTNALAEWRRSAELRHDEAGLRLADAREKGFAAGGLEGLQESELPVQKEIVDRGSGSAYALGTTYASLGKRQDALKYLQISFDRHEAAMLVGDVNPSIDNDREYQRLRALVNQRLAQ